MFSFTSVGEPFGSHFNSNCTSSRMELSLRAGPTPAIAIVIAPLLRILDASLEFLIDFLRNRGNGCYTVLLRKSLAIFSEIEPTRDHKRERLLTQPRPELPICDIYGSSCAPLSDSRRVITSRGSANDFARAFIAAAVAGRHSCWHCGVRIPARKDRTYSRAGRKQSGIDPITRQRPATKPRQIHCQRQMAHTLVRATNPVSIGAATYLPKD